MSIKGMNFGQHRAGAMFAASLMAGLAAGLAPAVALAETGVPTETVLGYLGATAADGAGPVAPPIQGRDGALYGTTLGGGAPGNGGTVYRLAPDGALITLHAFDDRTGSRDAVLPRAPLVEGTDGLLYGTAEAGGDADLGAIYAVSPSGGARVLVSVTDPVNGSVPSGGLVDGGDAFYGAFAAGGGQPGFGALYRVDRVGTLTTVYRFTGTQGAAPLATLSRGSDGALYGTTQSGAASGNGTVFRFVPGANSFSVLSTFPGDAETDGYAGPGSNGVVARDGAIYGSTAGDPGLTPSLRTTGSVFRIDLASGQRTVLHRFSGADGAYPASLVLARDGRLYGSTRRGGASDAGTLFRIAPDGSGFELLHSFRVDSRNPDASQPNGLTEASDGSLVGSAFASTLPRTLGGPDPRDGRGAIFQLVPRAPAVSLTLDRAVAAVGQDVTLRWAADAGAAACTASGGWRGARAASGSETVRGTRVGDRDFTLSCSNPAGTGTATATLTIVPAPSVTLTARPTITNAGNPSTTLTWTAVGATACIASNSWTGARPISSSEVVTPAVRGANRYTLTCSGLGGTSADSINVFRLGAP